jgi:hypothetical protein
MANGSARCFDDRLACGAMYDSEADPSIGEPSYPVGAGFVRIAAACFAVSPYYLRSHAAVASGSPPSVAGDRRPDSALAGLHALSPGALHPPMGVDVPSALRPAFQSVASGRIPVQVYDDLVIISRMIARFAVLSVATKALPLGTHIRSGRVSGSWRLGGRVMVLGERANPCTCWPRRSSLPNRIPRRIVR